jgi:hypothetical protein
MASPCLPFILPRDAAYNNGPANGHSVSDVRPNETGRILSSERERFSLGVQALAGHQTGAQTLTIDN